MCNFAPQWIINMPEILLHYIWQKGLFLSSKQFTTDGRPVDVISLGQHNMDAGPDFTNVHLRIDGVEWIGNVEIHIKSSDWYHHRHHQDPAYDSVILHVVREADKKVYNTQGDAIVQCELQYPMQQDYIAQMLHDARLMDSPFATHTCAQQLLRDPQLLTDGWKHALLRQRLECKTSSIQRLLEITNNDWNQAFYISLAHNFGFHTNGIPFEQLAIQTPLSCLQKHRNSLFQLTALLLGQSGLLTAENAVNQEEQHLMQEYEFLRKKFSLSPLSAVMWKYARIRPQNFPSNRIRQFAQLLYQSEFLFSKILTCSKINDLEDMLTLQAEPVELSSQVAPPLPLGLDSIRVLLINTILPYKYAHAKLQNDLSGMEQAFLMMDAIPAENNRIIRQWLDLGQIVTTAADSQALIHLYQNFCQSHQCLSCDVAYQIFVGNRRK